MFLSKITRRLRGVGFAALLAGLVLSSVAAWAQAEKPLFRGNEIIPSDAIILFSGKDLSQWVKADSTEPATWKIEKGYIEARDADIQTKQVFKDCQLHLEFWIPLMADQTGQGRGNSGLFFMGWTYELQVLDSYRQPLESHNCGSLYSIHEPIVNACRPPECWQSYDVVFHAPKFDEAGKKIANARATVFQNNVLIQDNVDIPFTTPGHSLDEPKVAGPFRLQWHGNLIRYRNIWIRPLPESK